MMREVPPLPDGHALLHIASYPGVVISLESAQFTVAEGGIQPVCVNLLGQIERSVLIQIFTESDTAQGE